MMRIEAPHNIMEEWEKYVSTIKSDPTVRPITLESWKRCEELGLEPGSLKFKFLSDEELEQKLQENSLLIENSKPYMDSISMSLTGVPHMVALSDSEGWIIDFRGVPEKLGGKKFGLCLGASWAEKNIGNNGIGTALETKRPVLVYGVEHFGMLYGSCACIGVPIVLNEKIIGALDISVPVQYAHPARLHIAIACARSIESDVLHSHKKPKVIISDDKLSATNQLIATAVHDLKNPLAVIRGLGQLGQITADSSKMNSYFARIIKQADEIDNMVAELLSIFRPEKMVSNKVAPVVEEVFHTFKPICNSKNIELLLINNADKSIKMNKKLLKRAIENLVNNAVQVMDKGGMITISTELDEDSILILIEDTAGGIPKELSQTLFEPFSYRRSGGTGLGLFMAYHTITSTHKGELWYETEAGKGTTFYIKLPIAQRKVQNKKVKQINQ